MKMIFFALFPFLTCVKEYNIISIYRRNLFNSFIDRFGNVFIKKN